MGSDNCACVRVCVRACGVGGDRGGGLCGGGGGWVVVGVWVGGGGGGAFRRV